MMENGTVPLKTLTEPKKPEKPKDKPEEPKKPEPKKTEEPKIPEKPGLEHFIDDPFDPESDTTLEEYKNECRIKSGRNANNVGGDKWQC